MNRIRYSWEGLRASFWFIPSLLVFASIVLAVGLVEIDSRGVLDLTDRFPLIFATGVEGAQGLLQAIATAIITVAGVTFSITILILNEASSQYSPRILRNFVRDRRNQVVLGVFLAVFVYCLVVLRSIHEVDGVKFVPPIAVTAGLAMAILAIGVFIFFIHHIAYSIQASTVIERIARETLEEIDALYPENLGTGADEASGESAPGTSSDKTWNPLLARESGYFQFTTPEDLIEFAEKHDTIVRLEYRIGEFVVEGTPLASTLADRPLPEKATKELLGALSISRHRTIEQDAMFGIRQLVDIAIKALSPSMNDPTTAEICLDYLTTVLARLSQRKMSSPHRLKDGKLRVIARRPDFQEYLSTCLEQIRQNARGNACVSRHLIHLIRTLRPFTDSPSRLRALKQQLDLVRESIETSIPSHADKAALLSECDGVG